jgi:hypothetical protein
MDLWSTLKVLARRWYLTIPVVVLSCALAYSYFNSKPADYIADSSMLILAPTTRLTPSGTGSANPYLQIGGTQTAVAEVLTTSLNSPAFTKKLRANGLVGTYSVALVGGDAPIIKVETTAPSSPEAVTAAKKIVDVAQQRLLALQVAAGSPDDQLMTLSIIDPVGDASADRGNAIKASGALLVVLLALSLGSVYGFEAFARSRRNRRASQALTLSPSGTASQADVSAPERARLPWKPQDGLADIS